MQNTTRSVRQDRKNPENLDLLVPDVRPVSTGKTLSASPEEHTRRQAAKLYEGGMSLAEVGEALGCSLPRARKLIEEAGVAIRPPGKGRKKKSAGLEKLPGLTWLPSDDDFMTQERRRMLRYMVEKKNMTWSACRKALVVSPEVLAQDLAALGLELEVDESAPEPSQETTQARRGRRLKDAEHLIEDLATMRSMEGQGIPLTDIGQLFGLSVATVKKRLAMTDADIKAHLDVGP